MKNYITVGSILTTRGSVTDITTNSIETVISAIEHSMILNNDNTFQAAENAISTTVTQQTVFEEIKAYLDLNLGDSSYTISHHSFEW
jgi:hypothetical protein